MVDGDLKVGRQVSGTVETSSNDETVVSWAVSQDIYARVEVVCVIQRKNNAGTANSYKLVCNVCNYTGTPEIIGIVHTFEEEGSAGIDVTLAIDGNDIIAKTENTDGNTYRIGCFMSIFSVEESSVSV